MPPQVGPATNDFMQYDIRDESGTLIGRLVTTGTAPTGISQPPRTSVWSWTDAGRTTFPGKFKLAFDASGDGGSPGSNHWTFGDGPFATPGSPPCSPGTFGVHRIRSGSASGTVVGHAWNKGTASREQHWSGLPSEIDAAGMYADRKDDLYFEAIDPPSIDSSWRWRDDTP
jgi:hypothetical protein